MDSVSLLEEFFVSLTLSCIYPAELYKMVCEKNETDLDIHIPAVLLPKDAGSALHTLLTSGNAGKLLARMVANISISI